MSPYPPERGGISEYTRSLAQALAEQVHVIVFARKVGEPRDTEGSGRVLVRRIWEPNSILAPFRLFREASSHAPDVVHLQYESYGLYGRLDFLTTPPLLLLLRLTGARVVVTLHSFLVSPSERMADRDYLASGALAKTIKYTYQVLRTTVRLSLRFANVVVVHSEFTAKRLAGLIDRAGRVVVIPIGAAPFDGGPSKQEARLRLGLNGTKMILFFGFISESKNIDELVDASGVVLEKYPDALVVISGIPAEFDPHAKRYHDELRRQASWTNRVVFIDRFVDTTEMGLLHAAADVLVMTYSIAQGNSAALSYALGYGIPVIVPEGGTSAKDVHLHGFGLTYKRGSAASLAEKIISVLSDADLERELAAKALKTANERTWAAVARDTLKVYRQ